MSQATIANTRARKGNDRLGWRLKGSTALIGIGVAVAIGGLPLSLALTSSLATKAFAGGLGGAGGNGGAGGIGGFRGSGGDGGGSTSYPGGLSRPDIEGQDGVGSPGSGNGGGGGGAGELIGGLGGPSGAGGAGGDGGNHGVVALDLVPLGTGTDGGDGQPSDIVGAADGGGGGAGGFGTVFNGAISGGALLDSGSGGAGGDGGASLAASSGGGGGGGGGGLGVLFMRDVSGTLEVQSGLTGGAGGRGGNGVDGGGGGGGGEAVVFDFNADATDIDFSSVSTLTGGRGGDGGDGGPGTAGPGGRGGNGGGGGQGIVFGAGAQNIGVQGIVSAGAGGNGGAGGGTGGSGGDGGAGGQGIVLGEDGAESFAVSGDVTGGAGGNGGDSGTDTGAGGRGGAGGAGIVAAAGGVITINAPGSVTGGDGGAGGMHSGGAGGTGPDGEGGVGIIGADLNVFADGPIAGGVGASGQANAITFTGGTNRLVLRDDYGFTGNVVADGSGDTLVLSGSADQTLDVSAIGAAGQYQGFSNFVMSGDVTWTLTGETPAVTPWTLTLGKLSVSANEQLGDLSGGITFNGGTLQNTASFSTARAISVNEDGGTFQTDANLTVSGVISGDGALTKTGAGTLTLAGSNTYEGGTTIRNGTFRVTNDGALGSGAVTVDVVDTVLGVATASLRFDGVGVAADGLDITIADEDSPGTALNSLYFSNGATAGTATITNNQKDYLDVFFLDNSDAGSATITSYGGLAFSHTSGAQDADIVNDGGVIRFSTQSTAGQADITNRNGGSTRFADNSTAMQASITNTAGGFTDISWHNGGLAIGSVSGNGGVRLGGNSLTLGGLNRNDTIDGVVADGGVVGGTGGSLIKAGSGTLTLNGANTYTGGTTVSEGTLVVGDADHAGAQVAGDLTVQNGATLGGIGTVGGAGTLSSVEAGGIVAPGNSIGTITLGGSLDLTAGAVLDYEFGTSGATAGVGRSDRIDIGEDLTLDGTLNLVQSTDATDGVAGMGYYRLMSYGGTLSDNGLEIGDTSAFSATSGFEVQADGGNVDLFVAALGEDTLQHWQGGDGTWDATNKQWLNQDGELSVAWAGNHAVFKNQPGGFSGGTIDVTGTQSFAGLQFVDEGYRLQGPGVLETKAAGSELRVLADSAEIATAITGSGGINKTQDGTLVLSGTNTYEGGTRLTAGALSVGSNANLGAATGALTFAGGTLITTADMASSRAVTLDAAAPFDVAAGTTLDLDGVVSGDGDLIKDGDGTLRLDNAANGYGNTMVEAGQLVGDADSISGNIANAATVTFDQAGDGSFAGDITGLGGVDGEMFKQGAGTLTLAGTSDLDWTVTAGGLETEAARFAGDIELDGADTALRFTDSGNGAYDGSISGDGLFSLDGAGTVLLTGDNAGFTGTTAINAGMLLVGNAGNKAAALGGSLDILDGATLGGAGTVGSGAGTLIRVASGGTLAPGNSIGTLTVNGDLAFDAGSTLAVEVDPQGSQSDLVAVTGNATLGGGTVAHIGATGEYDLQSTYRVLSAQGTLSGDFDAVSSDFAFLTPKLIYDYDSGAVDLQLARNDADFASAALTRNQAEAAEGIESIGIAAGDDVYDAIAQLGDDDELIRASFDALSGEIHASVQTSLIEDGRFIRNAANDRLRASFGDGEATLVPVLAYGPGETPMAVAPDHTGAVFWSHGFGSWGSSENDGNAASLDRETGGMLIGADGIAGDWRLGLLAGYSHSSFRADDRASSGASDNYHVGLYGGTQWGNVFLRTGASYTRHDIETSRTVAIPGLSDSLTGDYHAGSFQAFGELGYGIDLATGTYLEPFVNVAHVNVHRGGFSEDGGAGTLSISDGSTDVTFTTLGLRAEQDLTLGTVDASLRGMIGWRHAFGDVAPQSTQAFSAGDAFTVAGAPIAQDSAIIEAGLDLNPTPESTLGLSYAGQLSADAQDHGLKANLSVKF